MDASRKKIRVDVVSDIVCPWCFIGKRRLEAAIAARADRYEVAVHYHPFELNPDLPAEGADARTHYARRFGSWERFVELRRRVAEVGRADGIDFAFDKATRAPNTRRGHRLVWLARDTAAQADVVERLFAAHFLEGRDVGDVETLAGIAAEAGLDRAEVAAALAGDAGAAEVEAAERRAHALGVTGVPFFIVDGKWAVSGAQPVDAFVQLLDHAAGEPEA